MLYISMKNVAVCLATHLEIYVLSLLLPPDCFRAKF